MRTLLVALLLSTGTPAQEPARSPAERLVRSMMPPERYADMIDQMASQAVAGMRPSGSAPPSAAELEPFRVMMSDLMSYEDLIKVSTRIYTDHFSEREIGDLVAFYQTPTGLKMARLLPVIAGESMREVSALLQARLPAALEKHGLIPKPKPSPGPKKL